MTMTATGAPAGLHCDLNYEPAIYVACLASYNSGNLYGYWINLSVAETKEEIQECIDWILKHSPVPGAEEYAVHDSQGLCGPCKGTEWPDLDQLEELAHAYNFTCSDQTEWIAYRMLCNDENEILSEDDFRDRYCGVYDRPEDFAYELAVEIGHEVDGAKWPFSCVDWERAWRELGYDGYSAEYSSEAGGYIVTRPA